MADQNLANDEMVHYLAELENGKTARVSLPASAVQYHDPGYEQPLPNDVVGLFIDALESAGVTTAVEQLAVCVEPRPGAAHPWPIVVFIGGECVEFCPTNLRVTPEEDEAAYQEDLVIRRKDRAETRRQCLRQSECADEGSFDWAERVPDERKSEKCVGRCLCEEWKHRVVTIECDFSLDADGTLATLTVLPRTDR